MRKKFGIAAVLAILLVFTCCQKSNESAQGGNETGSKESSAKPDKQTKPATETKTGADTKPDAETRDDPNIDSEANVPPGTPRYGDYDVQEVYTGKTAPLIFDSDSSEFRTRLQEAAKNPVNFAGHYIFARWGCGTDCVDGAVIDAKTGKIAMMPFTVCCIFGDGSEEAPDLEKIEYRPDSRLIIFNGFLNENEKDGKKHYYKFENGRFIKIKSE